MKKILFVGTVLVFILIINGLLHSIYDLWHKQDLVTSAQKNLEAEQLKNQKLKADLSYVGSQEFIETEARNKLFLVKPGEQDVIIPPIMIAQGAKNQNDLGKPNWQKWIDLFK